jgi:superoxide dismutase
MGKKRINQLLEHLEANHQQELQNAAEIYTIAQVAVNKLEEISGDGETLPLQLPAAPILLTKTDLEQRYGSYNNCRKAAANLGIKFSGNPGWNRLVAGFSYFEALQGVVQSYLQSHPNEDLKGVAISFRIN